MDIKKRLEERKLLNDKLWKNPIVPQKNKDYLKRLLKAVEVTDVFIGDPMAYSGYEVLVIVAKGNGIVGFKMEYADNFVPAVDEEFFIEIGINDEYEGAIELSDSECNPAGFVDVI